MASGVMPFRTAGMPFAVRDLADGERGQVLMATVHRWMAQGMVELDAPVLWPKSPNGIITNAMSVQRTGNELTAYSAQGAPMMQVTVSGEVWTRKAGEAGEDVKPWLLVSEMVKGEAYWVSRAQWDIWEQLVDGVEADGKVWRAKREHPRMVVVALGGEGEVIAQVKKPGVAWDKRLKLVAAKAETAWKRKMKARRR